jgi:hypothetical protein
MPCPPVLGYRVNSNEYMLTYNDLPDLGYHHDHRTTECNMPAEFYYNSHRNPATGIRTASSSPPVWVATVSILISRCSLSGGSIWKSLQKPGLPVRRSCTTGRLSSSRWVRRKGDGKVQPNLVITSHGYSTKPTFIFKITRFGLSADPEVVEFRINQ